MACSEQKEPGCNQVSETEKGMRHGLTAAFL